MANGLAGKWMRLAKSSDYYKIVRCRSNLRYQWIETTNAESPPGSGVVAEEFVSGVYGGDVDFDIVYKPTDVTGGVINSLFTGAVLTVSFYPDKTTPSVVLTGSLSVESADLGSEVKNYQSLKITGKFNGGYTFANM